MLRRSNVLVKQILHKKTKKDKNILFFSLLRVVSIKLS